MNKAYAYLSSIPVSTGEVSQQFSEFFKSKPSFAGDLENNDHSKVVARALKEFSSHDAVVQIGIGGSILAARVFEAVLGRKKRKAFFLEAPDPASLEQVFDCVKLRKTLFYVVSKSGGTLETLSLLAYVTGLLKKERIDLRKNMLVCSGGGALARFAADNGIRSLNFPEPVGGRYSAMTPSGLLAPEFVAAGSAERIRAAAFEALRSPVFALEFAAMLCELRRRNIFTLCSMPYSSRLDLFSEWIAQLICESTGKNGNGITVLRCRCPADQHSFLQLFADGQKDKAFMFLTAKTHAADGKVPKFEVAGPSAGRSFAGIINAEAAGVRRALEKVGPTIRIEMDTIDIQTISALMVEFMIATPVFCRAIGINPFDQPAVELAKKLTLEELGK